MGATHVPSHVSRGRGQLERVNSLLPVWVLVIEHGLSGLAAGDFIHCDDTFDTRNLKGEGFL